MEQKYRRISIISISCIVLVIMGILLFAILGSDPEPEKTKVSVVITGSTGERWSSVKAGMNQAAVDNNIELNYVRTGQYLSVNDEWDHIKAEAAAGTKAVILEPVGSQGLDEKLSSLKHIPVILLESDIDPEDKYISIHANDYKVGRYLADALYSDYGEQLKDMKIGVLSAPIYKLSSKQRQQGLMDGLKKWGIKIAWSLGTGIRLQHTLNHQLSHSDADILVCTGDVETEIAVKCVKEAGKKIEIYGQGYSEENIYGLDKKSIKCLVMSNEFYIGYDSVALAADRIAGGNRKFDEDSIELFTLHGKDLYDEYIEKIVFPIIQ